MSRVEWVEVEPEDYRPILGPPCPGIDTHRWHLGIEEGRMSLWSGCDFCDEAVLSPIGGEDVFMESLTGALKLHHEVIGYETPEHTIWWEFVPNGGAK